MYYSAVLTLHDALHLMYTPGVLLKPDHQTEATGQTIELTCKVRGTSIDNLTYQWIIPGSVVVNGSNALTIPNTTVNDSGIYFCIVHAINGSNEGIKSNLANVSILGKFKNSRELQK